MEAILYWRCYDGGTTGLCPVLMLHGFMGRGDDWQQVSEHLAPSRQCLCPDLPGHGATAADPVNGAAGMPEIAEALLAGLEARGVTQCALVGYSMGGRLALYLAVRYPQRFSCLLLESASPGLRTTSERQQRQVHDEALEEKLTALGEDDAAFAAFLRTWYRQPLFATISRRPGLYDALVQRRLQNHPPSLAASLRGVGIASQASLWEALSGLRLPTLLITGAADKKYCDINAAMAARMPVASHITMDGCGHIPHLERPDAFRTALALFLRKYDQGVKKTL